MVGQQLHRDGVHDRAQRADVARGADHVHLLGFAELAVGIGEHEHLAAARAHFLDVGLHLLQQRVVRRDHHHRHRLVHQRQRTVLELTGRVGLGMDVGDFLELQRAFQRDRIMPTATEEQRMLPGRELVRPRRDLRLQVQRMLHAAGQVAQFVEVRGFLRGVDASAQLGQHPGQREQRHQLRGESLGRGDADLGAGAGVEHQFAGARDRAFRHVADRQRLVLPQRLRVLQRLHRVQGFAGLRDGDDELLRVGDDLAVAVFAGDVDRAGDAGDVLDPVARGQPRVIAGAAGEDLHRFHVGQHFGRIRTEQRRFEAAEVDDAFQGVADRARLLVDFLLHEVAVRAQLQRGQRHVGDVHVTLHLRVLRIEHAHAVAGDFGGVAFFEEDDFARCADDRGHVGGDEVLALAEADQQRAAHARGHHGRRIAPVDHRQRVRAVQFLHRLLQRTQQVQTLRAVMVDQVGDDFGVGLRGELVAQRTQAFALRLVVLDDAVVHQRQFAVTDVRMRVVFGDAAMRGPARVADAEGGVEAFGQRGGFHLGDAAGATHAAHRFAIDHRDAGRIVAAVFQPLQAIDQQRDHVTVGDGADDSTHAWQLLSGIAQFKRWRPGRASVRTPPPSGRTPRAVEIPF